MRALTVVAALLVVSSTTSVRADELLTHPIDVGRSRASFDVAHLYVAHVNGRLPISAGTVTLAPGSALPAGISATLDPKHVDTANADRDDDLQGPDWFDTKRFPTWTFVSTAIRAGTGNSFEVDGSLTVHGVAQPVVLSVATTRGLPHPAYHATGHLDRHAFGMPTTLQDGLIGTDVSLTLDVELR